MQKSANVFGAEGHALTKQASSLEHEYQYFAKSFDISFGKCY